MEHDNLIEELAESFINGNRGHVANEIFKLKNPIVASYVATQVYAKLTRYGCEGNSFVSTLRVHMPS